MEKEDVEREQVGQENGDVEQEKGGEGTYLLSASAQHKRTITRKCACSVRVA